MLKAARKSGVKVVAVSSIAAKRPDGVYAVSKMIGEDLCLEYGQVSARPTNVYGGTRFLELKDTVVARFIKLPVMTIYGDGEQRFDFIHVNDVVSGLVNSMQLERTIIDLGTGRMTSINELANIVTKHLKKPLKHLDVSNSKSAPLAVPTYRAETSLEKGIEETIRQM